MKKNHQRCWKNNMNKSAMIWNDYVLFLEVGHSCRIWPWLPKWLSLKKAFDTVDHKRLLKENVQNGNHAAWLDRNFPLVVLEVTIIYKDYEGNGEIQIASRKILHRTWDTLEFANWQKLGKKENLSAENKMGGAISYFIAPFIPPSKDGWREVTAKVSRELTDGSKERKMCWYFPFL